ncbi:hypothetical protein GGI10_002460, partial [Coemansia sp. RSA 2530]
EVGAVEIKSGGYICYPNFYQTKMPCFELADPTRPGHVKYIAFYVVDMAYKLVSTDIVPPQQPHWTGATESAEEAETALKNKKELEKWHSCRKSVKDRFDSVIYVGDY